MGHIQHVLKRCRLSLNHPWRSSVLYVGLYSNHAITAALSVPRALTKSSSPSAYLSPLQDEGLSYPPPSAQSKA